MKEYDVSPDKTYSINEEECCKKARELKNVKTASFLATIVDKFRTSYGEFKDSFKVPRNSD